MKEAKPVEWFTLTLTKKQVDWIRLLCRFHINESGNDFAMERSKKMLNALESSNFIRIEKKP